MLSRRSCGIAMGVVTMSVTACSGSNSNARGAQFEIAFRRTVSSSLVEDFVDDATLVGDSALVFVAGRQLLLSSSSGHTTAIASRGVGPCEIRGVVSLVSLSDSTFALADVANRRVQVRSLTACKEEISSEMFRFLGVYVSNDGLLARATGMGYSSVVLARIDSGRALPLTTLAPSGDGSAAVCGYCWLEVLSDGTVYGTTLADTVYRILHYRRDGTFVRTVTRDGVPLARVLDIDRDSINDLYRRMAQRVDDAQARRALEQVLRDAPLNHVRPLFARGPIADQQAGALLVSRSPESGKSVPVDIFELDSDRFIAEATLPSGTRLLKSTRRGTLAVRAVGDTALEFTVYRVRVQ